eukprot:Partr_v1_DN27846_c2_g1_i1_m22630 putative HID1 domain containing
MGASDSKLAVKKEIVRLGEETVSADDELWDGLFSHIGTPALAFEVLTAAECRTILALHAGNIETMVHQLVDRLIAFSLLPDAPSTQEQAMASVCLAFMARIIPIVFEDSAMESKLFWTVLKSRASRLNHPEKRNQAGTPEAFVSPEPGLETVPPLAERLLDALLNLLFMPGFTLLPGVKPTDRRAFYVIWESGIGASSAPAVSADILQNRVSVMRLLLVLFSKSMYILPDELTTVENRWLQSFVCRFDKHAVLAVLCSLLNTVIKYNPVGWVPYNHVLFGDAGEAVALLSAELFVLTLNYGWEEPVDEPDEVSIAVPDVQLERKKSTDAILPTLLSDSHAFNKFRFFLSKLHRKCDFELIFDGLYTLLTNPLMASSTYLPYSAKTLGFTEEILMIFWKMLETNKRFLEYACQNPKISDVAAALIFQAVEARNDPARVGLLRLSAFTLHLLSGERSFSVLLNGPCTHYPPASLEIPDFRGCTADLLVLGLYSIMFTTKGKTQPLYDCFLTIIANISPYIKSFAVVVATKLVHMFCTFSMPRFLLANEWNHILLFYLLDTFNNILQYQFDGNPHLVYEVLRRKDRFHSLKDMTHATAVSIVSDKQKKNSQDDLSQDPETSSPSDPKPLSPDSATKTLDDAWFINWHSQLPLHTIMAILENLGPRIEELCRENEWSDANGKSVVLKY